MLLPPPESSLTQARNPSFLHLLHSKRILYRCTMWKPRFTYINYIYFSLCKSLIMKNLNINFLNSLQSYGQHYYISAEKQFDLIAGEQVSLVPNYIQIPRGGTLQNSRHSESDFQKVSILPKVR